MTRTLLLCGLALLVVACAKSPQERIAEDAIERATGGQAQVEGDGDKITVQTEQGEVQITRGDAATLPVDFPKDVPLPQGYQVMESMAMAGTTVLALDAPGKVPGVAAQARDAMRAQGWKETTAMEQSDDTRIYVYEKDGRHANLGFYDNQQGGVRVGVQLTQKQ
ncbi:MAG: hypothetical protein LC715_05930 [Gammaproteobacteria bacterium]|nr:hypothetical protein [Gammaproteobacteria bacterium]